MRLRTLESFWLLKNGILHSYPSLQQNIQTQYVVLGGGITGALVSHALMEKGYKVILLDKRDIGGGSTAATTSMLQYEIDVPLYQLAEMIGEDAAATCYRSGVDAIKKLGALVESLGLNCGFEFKESLFVAHNKKSARWLQQEYHMRSKHGLEVAWKDAAAVQQQYGLNSFGAIWSQWAGSVDAYKLAHELIQYNHRRGMPVYDQTEVTEFELNVAAGPVLTTKEGFDVTAEKIIFCTGYEATQLLKEKTAKLFYTYATVSEKEIAIPDALKQTLVWDTDDPYIYMRTTDDGRLLVGGADGATAFPFLQQSIKEAKARKLKKKLEALLPGVPFIDDFNWGGIFGTTQDGLPYIGKSPEYEHALFALGFGGNGIAFSVQAMDIITSLLAGEEHHLTHYYRFGR